VESVALKLKPKFSETKLQLYPRGNFSRPLIGFQVRFVPKTFAKDESQSDPFSLVTDCRGIVRVPYNPQQPILWVYVSSGEAKRARVPFVPGMQESIGFQLPDDSLRLATEGEIALLRDQIVDAVSRRAVLVVRGRKLARDGKWDQLGSLTKTLEALPGVTEFRSRLTAIRVPAMQEAQRQKNRVAEAKIRRLCSNASKLIEEYLSEDKIQAVKEEFEELKQLQ